jgi:hypothetical protein
MPRAALLVILFSTLLGGCQHVLDRATDAAEADKAVLAGYGEIRTYRDARADEMPTDSRDWAPSGNRNGLDFLIVSGGGSGGAFSVGVLSAWSDMETRPSFDVVTGVSTGALIAPYAFLGSSYDAALVHLYTSGIARKLVASKGPAGIFGSSLLKDEPLRRLVESAITPAVLRQVAAEHRKGRRLFVLTTNLDTQRGVVWNMGAIGASGRLDAQKLFHDIIVASASIPGVYPAVMITAQADGREFQEMHSDGGAVSQMLMPPQALLASSEMPASSREREKVRFYAIVNNALMPEFDATRNRTLSAISRAYSINMKSQAQSELTALYNFARRTGAEFHVAAIDEQIPYSVLDPFDTEYMQAVYDVGYTRHLSGGLWKDTPVFR